MNFLSWRVHLISVKHSDVERIQAGIGDKLSLFIDNFATFGGGFVIAFVVNWKMALIVAIMLPLIVGEAAFLGKVCWSIPLEFEGTQ